jgi:hypothetical protein
MEHLLNQTCTIFNTPSAPDDFGVVTWASSETIACRAVRTMKHTKDNYGNELEITLKLQISQQTVDIGTKIDFESRSYLVSAIKDWRGYDGELFGSLLYLSNYPI